MSHLDCIINLLKYYRFNLGNEKALQLEIEIILNQNKECRGYRFNREHRLSKKHIIDFLIDGKIGIEVKIGGSPIKIFNQVASYCDYDDIDTIILLTNKIMRLPAYINGKPTHVINLGTAWL